MKQLPAHTILSDMDYLKIIIEDSFLVKLMSNNRRREVVNARMVFAKIIRERGHTFKSIGIYLKKDHSTIIHYVEQASNIVKQEKNLMDLYIDCKNKFLENREPLVAHTDRDLVREILSLRNQLDDLILDYQNLRAYIDKYERIKNIINLIDARTEVGKENLIKKRINEMFNDL